jgi:hypothetical protein
MEDVFYIRVKANVDNTYGANVYAFAMLSNVSVTNAEIVQFTKDHLANVTQMHVEGEPTTFHVESNVSGNTINMEANISDMFTDFSNGADIHAIPYAYTEYSVYVVAHNDLGLYASHADNERYNEYTVILNEDIIVNVVEHTKSTIVSNVSDPVSNILNHYTLAFLDPNTTEDMASWYLDQRIEASSLDPVVNKVDVTSESPSLSSAVGYVVGNINDPGSYYAMPDVNHSKIFVVTRDVGPSPGLTGIEYHSADIESVLTTTTAAQTRVRRFDLLTNNVLAANVSGYNSVEGLGVPTRFKLLALERNANLDTSGLGTYALANVHGTAYDIPDGRIMHVSELLSANITQALANLDGTMTIAVDPATHEYELYTILELDNGDHYVEANLLTTEQRPTHSDGTTSVVVDTLKPSIVLSGAYTANIHSHEFVANTEFDVVASTIPSLTKSNIEAVLTAGGSVYRHVEPNVDYNITIENAFLKLTELAGNIFTDMSDFSVRTSSENVNRIYLYPYIRVEDHVTGYLLTKTGTMFTSGGYDPTALSTNGLFPYVTNMIIQQSGTLTANLVSVFNNTPDGPFTAVYAFVTDHTPYNSANIDYIGMTPVISVNIGTHQVYELPDPFLSFGRVYESSGEQITIQAGRDYYLNVVSVNPTSQIYTYNQDFSGTVVGVTSLSAAFSSSGNIEITSASGDTAEIDSKVNFVAYTYDVLANVGNDIDAFQARVYDSPMGAVVTRTIPTEGFDISQADGVFLDHVVDINLDVENAFATNEAYVYIWVTDPSGTVPSSVFLPGAALTPADRFYPFVADQPADAYDGQILTVHDASVVESNVVSGVNQKVDRYYLFAFDTSGVGGGVPSADVLLANFASNVESQLGVLGHFADPEPNIGTYDIHVAQNATFTHVFTDYSDPSATKVMPINTTVKIVLLAVNTPSHTAKKFVRDFTIPDVVPGVRGMGVSFSDFNANVAVDGGLAYGNVAAGHTVNAIAYTYPETIANVNRLHANVVSVPLTAPLPLGLSTSPMTITHAIDTTGARVPVSAINEAYVYAWVDSSLISQASGSHSPDADNKVYARLAFETETNTELVFNGSVFNANVDSNVDSYHVALFENDAVSGKTIQELANFVVVQVGTAPTDAIRSYTTNTIEYGEAELFNGANIGLAFGNVDTASTGPLRVGTDYMAYLVSNMSDGTNRVERELAGVVTKRFYGLSAMTLARSPDFETVTVSANVSATFESANVVAYVSMFTYPESNADNYEPHKQVLGVTDAAFTAFAPRSLSTLVDAAQESESVFGASAFYAYAWVNPLNPPTTHAIEVDLQTIEGANKYVFTPNVDYFVPGDTYEFANIPDGSDGRGNHPLYFSTSTDWTQDSPVDIVSGTPSTGTLTFTVPLDPAHQRLYAHCNSHNNMGSVVNGVLGIPLEYNVNNAQQRSEIKAAELVVQPSGGVYPRVKSALVEYDTIRIPAGSLSLFNNTANVERYYLAAFVSHGSVPSNPTDWILGNVAQIAQAVPQNDVFYNDADIVLDYALDPTDGSQIAVRSDTVHTLYLIGSDDSSNAIHNVTVSANLDFPIVTSFQGVLDFPEGNIDIENTQQEFRAGNVSQAVNFYMSAFTFDVMDHAVSDYGNVELFNNTVRDPTYRSLVTFENPPGNVITNQAFANITASIVDTDLETVPVATANVAYMYMWAEIDDGVTQKRSAVTASTVQVTSTSPYPRIRETTVDNGNISVTSASVFTPNSSNIDKFYMFTVQSGSGIDDTNVTTFAASLSATDVTGLLEFHDFDPDLVSGNVFSIPNYTFDKAYAKNANVDDFDNLIPGSQAGGIGYIVYLVVVEAGTSATHFHKTDTLYTTGTYVAPISDVPQPNITYFNLDTSVVNDHQLTATFETLEANLEYYAVVHAYPSASQLDTTALMALLTPVFTAQEAQLTDPYYTSFTLTNAVDVQGNVVDIHTMNPAYLYVWAYDPVLDQVSLFEEQSGSVQETETFGDPPPSEPSQNPPLAFHYGTFDNAYGDGNVETAALNGRVYENTPIGTYSWGALESAPTTSAGQTTYSWTLSTPKTANVLMVAGGGGGGGAISGGGGAGGVVYTESATLSGTMTVSVGNGGTGGLVIDAHYTAVGSRGYNTSFTNFVTANGGGGGGSYRTSAIQNGGSGGGDGLSSSGDKSGTLGQGYAGGEENTSSPYGGGGGGGAGGTGGNASGVYGGHGGPGVDYSHIFGSTYGDNGWFASGGGGSISSHHSGLSENVGTASLGGGSNGNHNAISLNLAQHHTGGGGGGGGYSDEGFTGSQGGDSGGSGIVLIADVAYTPPPVSVQITSTSIVRQSPFFQTNNMSNALDSVYTESGPGTGWVAADNPSSYVWGWLDLGTEHTITKIRLWQNAETGSSYPEERYIGDFSLTMTNDYTKTSDDSYSTDNFVKYSTDMQRVIWKYANASGELVVPVGNHTFGGANDPTISILRSATTGFHEFSFASTGTGRYLLFKGWAVSRLARLNELQIFGYSTI